MEIDVSNFIILKTSYVLKKFEAESEDITIALWNENQLPAEVTIESIDKKKLRIKSSDIKRLSFSDVSMSEVYLHFVFANFHYFFNGQFDIKKGIIRLNDECYKYDKRSKERLLCFPHRDLYIYFDFIPNDDVQNVFSISHIKTEKIGFFENYLRISTDESFYGRNKIPMTGFRLLDLSQTGASFVANANEAIYFKNNKEIEDVKLKWESAFNIGKVYITNVVDYIDHRTINISMFKIGVVFEKINKNMQKKLKLLLDEDILDNRLVKNYVKYLNEKLKNN